MTANFWPHVGAIFHTVSSRQEPSGSCHCRGGPHAPIRIAAIVAMLVVRMFGTSNSESSAEKKGSPEEDDNAMRYASWKSEVRTITISGEAGGAIPTRKSPAGEA